MTTTTKKSSPNVMARPRLAKVVLNAGIGRIILQAKDKDELLKNLSLLISLISGQKPKVINTKKSIASFKLRKGMPVGIMVTLRGKRAHDFVVRLVNLVLPRVRDFRGLSPTSVSSSSLTIGFREHIVFPEVAIENAKAPLSLEATLVLDAPLHSKEEAKEFFKSLGFRFKEA